jgi:hypothetical protein
VSDVRSGSSWLLSPFVVLRGPTAAIRRPCHRRRDAPRQPLGARRQLEILTSLSAPLHAGDWIDISSGIETDQLLGGLTISVSSQLCAGLGATRHDPGAIGVQVPADLAQRWMCGAVPAAGTRVPATLELTLWVSAPMTCIRPQIATCAAGLPTLTVDAPVDVQF